MNIDDIKAWLDARDLERNIIVDPREPEPSMVRALYKIVDQLLSNEHTEEILTDLHRNLGIKNV